MKKRKSKKPVVVSTPSSHIINQDVTKIMKTSYINYAMNVIVSRALPDVRDGLKPVHRRILYAMKELKLTGDSPKKKSARVVGDIIGKYHPHGDSAVYETMVRMAQDFSYRYPLVEGQGNFGSIDGDPAAAMRYTEAKLTPVAEELLNGLDKDTVDFIENFDGTETEPSIMPSRLPHLLLNGSSGIAVGMATNMPPHNASEAIDTVVSYIKNPKISDDKLIEKLNGPDFPSGGLIVGRDELKQAYLTGRGKLTLRGKVSIEEGTNGRPEIVITAIPFNVNKPRLIDKIATLVREGKIEDILDIRDETDKEGLRIVIEFKKGASSKVIVEKLFSLTDLQTTFGVINLVVVDGEPQVLNLRQIVEHYVKFQREIIERRSRFELDKARARAHILEGLVIVGQHVDDVVATIRSSRSSETARQKLCKQFGLTDIQAQAILDLRLSRITGIEVSKTKAELKEYLTLIKKLEKVLSSPKEIDEVIKQELLELKKKFNDPRRTEIIDEIPVEEDAHEFSEMVRKSVVVSITNKGHIYSVEEAVHQRQKENEKRKDPTNPEEFVTEEIVLSSNQTLGVFTREGTFHRIQASAIPTATRVQKGTTVHQLANLSPSSCVSSYLVFDEESEGHIVLFTRLGLVKRMDVNEILKSRNGILSLKLKKEDSLLNVAHDTHNEFVLTSRKGKVIRLVTNDIRPMGRVAAGVTAMALDEDDHLVGVHMLDGREMLLVLTENGFGKRVSVTEFKRQKRAGKGVKFCSLSKRHGLVVQTALVSEEENLSVGKVSGTHVWLVAKEFPLSGRESVGVSVLDMESGDCVSYLTPTKE